MTDHMPVGPNTEVTLHFALCLDSGEEVDSNFEGDAATFKVGDGNMLPGFERALFGLCAGDATELTIAPEEAFGERQDGNIQQVPRTAFDEALELEEGLVLSFSDPQGNELPGVVADIGEDKVSIDFNHPLAGQTIIFRVKILNVSPSVTH